MTVTNKDFQGRVKAGDVEVIPLKGCVASGQRLVVDVKATISKRDARLLIALKKVRLTTDEDERSETDEVDEETAATKKAAAAKATATKKAAADKAAAAASKAPKTTRGRK